MLFVSGLFIRGLLPFVISGPYGTFPWAFGKTIFRITRPPKAGYRLGGCGGSTGGRAVDGSRRAS